MNIFSLGLRNTSKLEAIPILSVYPMAALRMWVRPPLNNLGDLHGEENQEIRGVLILKGVGGRLLKKESWFLEA